VYKTIAEAAFV